MSDHTEEPEIPLDSPIRPVVPSEVPEDEAILPPDPPAPEAAAEESPPAEPETPAKQGDTWIETIKTVVYALLIALVIRTFLFQPFFIPSGSMEATLLVGDYLFVEKFAYGYSRSSFPWRFPPFSGRVFGSAPTRGDVVVFKMPNAKSPRYLEDYIKRVVGMPGDRVQMIQGVLYINDKPVPKVPVAPYVEQTPFGFTQNVPQFRETLPGGKSYLVLDRGVTLYDDTPVYVVPAGHYFMMGDNRDDSDDSRGEVGYVPAENLVGRAELRFFSIDETAVWYEPWTWPGAIRFSRMFQIID
jgi:signal peptidase I